MTLPDRRRRTRRSSETGAAGRVYYKKANFKDGTFYLIDQ